MGPRSFNRGNERAAADRARRSALASMGPRSFNRGNVRVDVRWIREERGFNGAAVFQPRKFGQLRLAIEPQGAASMGPRSFNRGNFRRQAPGPEPGLASMGPRSFNRGNREGSVRRRVGKLCFNGAAVFQPRKWGPRDGTSSARMGASMGPRSFNRGNRPSRSASTRQRKASMGPRSFNRGNHRGVGGFQVGRHASMGPRSFNRGNAARGGPRRSSPTMASMGPRSFNRGNVCNPPAPTKAPGLLQWGRGLSTAEMRP